jgi:CubicO group peptidase (beta-lactamase class C family)
MKLLRASPVVLFLISALLLILVFVPTVHGQKRAKGIARKLDSIFASVPDYSGELLVAEKGKAIYHKSFGYKNFNTGERLSRGAIFEIASVSKQFTAMSIMLMQQTGKLSFDDGIEKYIPGLPYQGVTIRHLLNHTSGLPDYQEVMDKHWDKSKVAGNADNIEYLIKYQPPVLFIPGTKYAYSNTGYMLLASITEKVSGLDFVQFCRERFFRPFGLKSTDIRSKEEKQKLPNMAVGHIFVADQKRFVPADSFPAYNYAIWLGKRVGPGRVSSTAEDLLRWDRVLYTSRLIGQDLKNQAFSPAFLNDGKKSNYGFGWELQQHAVLGKIVRHSGDNPGYRTQFIRYVDADKTVILFCNNDHPRLSEVVKGIEMLMGESK